ncbi:hypothetical protein [Hymenobacter sp. DG25A]|uniref:hypothetical protein n=1 Tax=Hymenobacter sp. DG25A TaxID=1385663 RepID=UPI0006BDB754|nr:hypothetical protein [Hymenobacter sp. DG25A]ALD21325.1 hypothetical protein AM218_08970 [Hymenobacter sp. DG25A]
MMEIPQFDKLVSLVGISSFSERIDFVFHVDQLMDIYERVGQQCKLCIREYQSNILGLSVENQISYLEDMMYRMDHDFDVHSVRTHTTKWEAWLHHYIEEGKMLDENSHLFGIEHTSNKLAVRALIEKTHQTSGFDKIGCYSLSPYFMMDILKKCDRYFLREMISVLIDEHFFHLREDMHRFYIFKGGSRLKSWLKWNHEENDSRHLSETSTYSIIFNSLKYNGAPPSLPPVKWLAGGVDLFDLLISLSEKGYINIPLAGEHGNVSMERICKAICCLFDISGARRKDSKTEDWEMLRQYFKETTFDKLTRKRVYDRLKEDKRHFANINPVKPRHISSK